MSKDQANLKDKAMDGDDAIDCEKLHKELLELRINTFGALNKKMENVKKIADQLTNTKGMQYKPRAVFEIFQERKKILEKAFVESVSEFFVLDVTEGKFFLKTNADLKSLKVIIKTLNHELGLLSIKLDLFERLGKPETSSNSRNNGSENDETRLGLLSIKLKILKHYLVFAPSNNNNNCAVAEINSDSSKAGPEILSEFSDCVRTPKELVREKVIEMMLERRENFEQSRENSSDKSLIELMEELENDQGFRGIWKNTFDRLNRLTVMLGTRLCLCVSEFMFVAASESEGAAIRQFQNCFKYLMTLLVEYKKEKSSVAIRKVLFVIEFAEKELVEIGVLKEEVLVGRDWIGDDEDFGSKEMSPREAEFDKVLNLLVKHVAWVESALSNPFSLGLHSEDDFTSCYVEMAITRKKVHDLLGKRGLEESIKSVMTRFRRVMELKIAEKWAKLEE